MSDHREADCRALLEGVEEISAPGTPGGVTAFGPRAFTVIAGREAKSLIPVVAATRHEKGRAVAFGHNGYLGDFAARDTGRLLLNALRWSAGASSEPEADSGSAKTVRKRLRIGVLKDGKLTAWLKEQGCDPEPLGGDGWTRRLGGLDAVIANAHDLRAGRQGGLEDLARYFKNGGGLVLASCGWGWESGSKGQSLVTAFPANQLLAPAGLVFNNTTPGKTTASGYSASPGDTRLSDASRALDALLAPPDTGDKPDPARQAQISTTLSLAIRSVPLADPLFRARLTVLQKQSAGARSSAVWPAPSRPLTVSNPLGRLLFALEMDDLSRLPPDKTPAHPSAADFPGSVPAHAPRISRTVRLDTSIPGWHSLGLYAAPGQKITLTSPRQAASGSSGYRLRIGCHNDRLWHKDKWPRSPEICRSLPVSTVSTELANAFGGLVYIEVPSGRDGTLEFTVAGAVEAPFFELGRTTEQEWATRRQAAGPWAELACPGVILTVPSSSIRHLRNPEELMKFWNAVVEAEDWLAATEEDRRRPERIVADVEISAGYMHSGYPIMTYLDVVPMVSDLNAMRRGSWGHFHELGHNHQQTDWTPEGTGEVTCNLFTLYVYEKVCGIPVEKARGGFTPEAIRKTVRNHLAAGAPLQRWKKDPFLALVFYVQLQQAFGWETFRTVFRQYKTLADIERPRTEEDRHSQFMVRFSKETGKNLGPFFKAWGLPVSVSAQEEISRLPAWMPDSWPE